MIVVNGWAPMPIMRILTTVTENRITRHEVLQQKWVKTDNNRVKTDGNEVTEWRDVPIEVVKVLEPDLSV